MINREFSVFTQSPKPWIEVYRVSGSGESSRINLVMTIGMGRGNSNLISYSFSRNVNSLYGDFEIQVKEDYTQPLIMDSVKPLDIVYIYENDTNDIAFMGIVQNISFGATADAFNKSVVISGASIGILFEMMKISTDATSMAFFVNNSSNKDILNKLNNLLQQNVEAGGIGMSFSDAFNVVYEEFIGVLANPQNSRISANGIYDIIRLVFGEPQKFFKSNNLKFNYQIAKNLFSSDEVNIYSYFKDLLPEQVYEFYETVENNKPVLITREKPFDVKVWNNLKKKVIMLNPALITDYTFTKSDNDVHTCFMAMVEGTSLSSDFYKIINSTAQGTACFESDIEKIKKYGYRPLIVNFIGYSNSVKSSEESSYLNKTFIGLSQRLKEWYSRIDEMYSGDVTMIYNPQNKVNIGNLVELCGATFYVSGEKHSWSYGDAQTVSYTLERGGNYSETGFNPVLNISSAFAELLKRD